MTGSLVHYLVAAALGLLGLVLAWRAMRRR